MKFDTPTYQLTIPYRDNAGNMHGLADFERFLLNIVCGYSRQWSQGQWCDGNDTHKDYSAVYTISCDPAVFATIVFQAKCRFPDQKCFYVVEIGKAAFVPGLDQG